MYCVKKLKLMQKSLRRKNISPLNKDGINDSVMLSHTGV